MQMAPESRRRPVWPWAVLLIVLSFITWWVLRPKRHAPVVAESNAVVTDSVSGPDPVDAYLAFIADSRAAAAMAPDHHFVATAVDKLAAALEALAPPTTPGVARDVDALRAQARALQQDASSLAHADTAHAAFVRLGSLMSAVQMRRSPSHVAEVERVHEAAERLDPNRPLLDQREAVQRFLDRSAEGIRSMAGESGQATGE